MTAGRYGATAVISSDGTKQIEGIITDGDLRRALEAGKTEGIVASDLMTANPLHINSALLASKAASMMNERGVSQILVVDDNSSYVGVDASSRPHSRRNSKLTIQALDQDLPNEKQWGSSIISRN